MDDIFYIRSARSGWTDSYIQMKSDGTCQTVTNKLDVGVKWKLVSLMSDPKNQNFIITSLDWPGRFMYLDSPTGNIRGKRDLERVKEKGLWKIRDCWKTIKSHFYCMLNTNVPFGREHTESVFINKVIFSANSVRCFGFIRKPHESNIKLIRNIKRFNQIWKKIFEN